VAAAGEVGVVQEDTTGTLHRVAGLDTGDAARQFLAWLGDEANPALTKVIQGWLWQRALGGPAACAWDVALLRAEVLATWPQPHIPGQSRPAGQPVRRPGHPSQRGQGVTPPLPSAPGPRGPRRPAGSGDSRNGERRLPRGNGPAEPPASS
jgi:hypothetical protein